MLKTVQPEQIGIESAWVNRFLSSIKKRNLPMHSLLLMRNDQLFLEAYWAPFSKNRIHRMYSVTKSFVSVGIGLAVEDGLIDLDRPISSYFPEKLHSEVNPEVLELTVRQLLTMTTAGGPGNWFTANAEDRTAFYFRHRAHCHPAGTQWKYDSAGSQVLCALVEKITGKKLLDYLHQRIFCQLDAFENARMLQIANGDSWGDSALLCTSRDLAAFARFVMHYGNVDGKQLLSKDYLQNATSKLADNRAGALGKLYGHGYGYQFWKTEKDGFAMVGMGGQMAVCLPKQGLILVCTADLQGIDYARDYIIAQFLDLISDNLQDAPLAPNPVQSEALAAATADLQLYALTDRPDSPMRQQVDGVVYKCNPNPLGWNSFTLHFDDPQSGTLTYEKESGIKQLPFYINRNRFCKFPETGYSGQFGGQKTTDGSLYDAAVSAAWVEDSKLLIHTQIIDDYLGQLLLELSFKDEQAVVTAVKYAENFMNDYNGEAVATLLRR